MHRILVVLYCIIFVIVIDSVWLEPVPSINADAVELTRLAEEFWSLKPSVYENKGPLVLCQFIDECCTDENRLQAISVIGSSIVNEYRSKNRYSRVLNACMNLTSLEEANQSCSLLQQIISPVITKQEKVDIIEHRYVISKHFIELNKLTSQVYKSCSSEEIHALLCLSNTKLVTTCANKMLQGLYDDMNFEAYDEFIMKTKQTLTDLNQQLSWLSMKNKRAD